MTFFAPKLIIYLFILIHRDGKQKRCQQLQLCGRINYFSNLLQLYDYNIVKISIHLYRTILYGRSEKTHRHYYALKYVG